MGFSWTSSEEYVFILSYRDLLALLVLLALLALVDLL